MHEQIPFSPEIIRLLNNGEPLMFPTMAALRSGGRIYLDMLDVAGAMESLSRQAVVDQKQEAYLGLAMILREWHAQKFAG